MSGRPERSRAGARHGAAERRLGFMTWLEVDAALRGGCNRIVVPFGAVEQHDRHLHLDTDSLLGDHLGPLLAQRLDALCAPTVRVGCSDQHMERAGTLSLRPETLQLIVHDIVYSLAHHGFRTIVQQSGVRVVTVADMGALESAMQSAAEQHLSDAAIVHAGEIETSLVLALDPGAVRDAGPGATSASGLAYVKAFIDDCIRQLEEQEVKACSYA